MIARWMLVLSVLALAFALGCDALIWAVKDSVGWRIWASAHALFTLAFLSCIPYWWRRANGSDG